MKYSVVAQAMIEITYSGYLLSTENVLFHTVPYLKSLAPIKMYI
jgi:hypothetical protein